MTEDSAVQRQEELAIDPEFKEMIDAGVFYGRKKSKTHPRMKPYILGNRNGIEIINLLKTKEFLGAALEFLKEKAAGGAKFLFVATQPPALAVKETAKELEIPAVTSRWLGGMLTNFQVIYSRLEYFRRLKSNWEKGEFEKYTKKERLNIEREMRRLEELFAGLENLVSLPEVVIIIDTNLHRTACKEARRVGIPVVAFINTDGDPTEVDYPVAGNTRSRASIEWFIGKVKGAILEGRKVAAVAGSPEEKNIAKETVLETNVGDGGG